MKSKTKIWTTELVFILLEDMLSFIDNLFVFLRYSRKQNKKLHFRDQHDNLIERELAKASRVCRVFAQEQARERARSFKDDPNARWTRMGESPESGTQSSDQVREASRNKMILKSPFFVSPPSTVALDLRVGNILIFSSAVDVAHLDRLLSEMLHTVS